MRIVCLVFALLFATPTSAETSLPGCARFLNAFARFDSGELVTIIAEIAPSSKLAEDRGQAKLQLDAFVAYISTLGGSQRPAVTPIGDVRSDLWPTAPILAEVWTFQNGIKAYVGCSIFAGKSGKTVLSFQFQDAMEKMLEKLIEQAKSEL